MGCDFDNLESQNGSFERICLIYVRFKNRRGHMIDLKRSGLHCGLDFEETGCDFDNFESQTRQRYAGFL